MIPLGLAWAWGIPFCRFILPTLVHLTYFSKKGRSIKVWRTWRLQKFIILELGQSKVSSSSPVRSSTRGRSTNCDSFTNSDGERSTLLHVSTRSAGSSTAAEV